MIPTRPRDGCKTSRARFTDGCKTRRALGWGQYRQARSAEVSSCTVRNPCRGVDAGGRGEGEGMRRGADEKGRDGNDRQSPPRHRPATAPPLHSTGSHRQSQAVTPLHRQSLHSTGSHSTLEVAPENPPDATHFLKENANGLANKLRGPSLPPASIPGRSGIVCPYPPHKRSRCTK